jgi:hypothetical protein
MKRDGEPTFKVPFLSSIFGFPSILTGYGKKGSLCSDKFDQ